MRTSFIQELTLYRFRYIIGYTLVFLVLIGLLLVDINSVPNGIRDREIDSVIASNSLNPLDPRASDVLSLPYHLLQKLSVGLLGLTPFSIRLPSLVLGVIACIVLTITLNMWFRRNIATMATLLAITSVPFISMSRSGTAAILYMLLLLIILMSAAKLTTQKTGTFFWKLMVLGAGIMLLYMPLGIYSVVALCVAGIFHPHVRYQFKRTSWWQYLVLALLALILTAPVIYASIKDPSTLVRLIGIADLNEKLRPSELFESSKVVLTTLFGFDRPRIGEVLAPFLGLTATILVIFGLVRAIIDRHAARSYLLLLWIGISIPLLILNPGSFPLLFVPCVFLMAIGLEAFMREWYDMFPRNPYARLVALIPVTLIVLGTIVTATSQYFYGFFYTDTRGTFQPELTAIQRTIKPHVDTQLVVPTEDIPFYDILRSKYPLLSVGGPDSANAPAGERIVFARANTDAKGTPKTIVTSMYKSDGVLLRVYGPTQ